VLRIGGALSLKRQRAGTSFSVPPPPAAASRGARLHPMVHSRKRHEAQQRKDAEEAHGVRARKIPRLSLVLGWLEPRKVRWLDAN
jgi:hypothetical protein